jgi:hypothetical protein
MLTWILILVITNTVIAAGSLVTTLVTKNK